MNWFEEWFDSPLYEQLYSNRNEDEAALLADLIEQAIPVNRYPAILDLGCGRGRHSITLALRGYQVTGVDLSEEAINRAKQRALQKKAEAEFLVGDMRQSLKMKFDAIVNLFTTFGYFIDDHENARVITNASSMLKPDGYLMIDFLNALHVKKKLVPDDSGSFKHFTYHVKRFIENGMVFKQILFDGPSLDKPVHYTERVKLYDLNWFLNVFNDHHLELVSACGNYEGASFDAETSPRLIMLCRKTG